MFRRWAEKSIKRLRLAQPLVCQQALHRKCPCYENISNSNSNNQRSWLNTTGVPLCFPPPSHAILQPFRQHVSLADAPGERHWAAVCSYPGTSGQWIWKAACWVKVAAAFLMMGSTEERTEVHLWQPHTTEESGYSLLRVIYSPALGVTSVSFRCRVWNSVSFLLTFQRLLADSSSSARVTHTL